MLGWTVWETWKFPNRNASSRTLIVMSVLFWRHSDPLHHHSLSQPETHPDSGRGCVPCHCNSFGSKSFDCDEGGQCRCQPGVNGQKCDRCKLGHFNFQEGGCTREATKRLVVSFLHACVLTVTHSCTHTHIPHTTHRNTAHAWTHTHPHTHTRHIQHSNSRHLEVSEYTYQTHCLCS